MQRGMDGGAVDEDFIKVGVGAQRLERPLPDTGTQRASRSCASGGGSTA